MAGWIKLYRQIQECDIWLDEEPFDRRSAWIDLLLLANHEDKNIIFDGHKITVQRGQYLTSVRKLSAKWKWGKNKTLSFLRLLEECEMIKRESDSRRTLITLVNYDIYQSEDNIIGTVTGQSEDSNGTVTGRRQATNKNIKNDKNDKNNNIGTKHKHGEYQHVLLTDKEMNKLIETYGKDIAERAIEFLDAYIEEKGYKAKSHYLTIRRWVIDAVKEKKNNGRPGHDVRRNEEDDKELDEAVERFLAGDYDDEPLF